MASDEERGISNELTKCTGASGFLALCRYLWLPRIVPSRFRLPQRQTRSLVTDAAKLLQSMGLSFLSSNLGGNDSLDPSSGSVMIRV
ncbi:hypothetical protein L6452_16710 [Arctium lappa]|uniref:Uncharacterized protein n=1 Tax=Arctium lappa TaxID=4217 RepID=A0ACB9C1Q4_ARCLA|nr:hypothetical protein L6452_16710 [Arctium lappa]